MRTLIKLSIAVVLSPLAAQNGLFGLPQCSSSDREFIDHSYFVVCHDSSKKGPAWVAYELTQDRVQPLLSRPKYFRQDTQLAGQSASNNDYRHSGFVRGHMAPAADFAWSQDAVRSTFVLSNVVPQYQNPNSGRWAQLEAATRNLAKYADAIYVVTGTIFEGAAACIGEGCVAVPSHTYKVVLAVAGQSKLAFAAVIPNSPKITGTLDQFVTTVDEVERRTGLDFFAALENEEELLLESQVRQFTAFEGI